ncbi:MAG: hypothetical protein DRI44_06920, partial [Chlamydiae bacterium]
GCDCVNGQRQACGTSDVGECQLGEQECVDGQWSECAGNIEPIEELCDAKDNDCDGDIDEDFPDLGKSCVVGVGECQNSGKYICSDDKKSVVCDAKPLEPQEENCADNLDNDCDGVINNGCPCQTGEERQCGETDTGECKFGVQKCVDGQWGDKCEGEIRPIKEFCDAKDNDCDGQIDEDFSNLGKPCSVGVGACENKGEYLCSQDQKSTVCSVTEALPPDCAGKECGDDGCGGSCGECGNNQSCVSNVCECNFIDCNSICCDNGQTCYANHCCTPKTCSQQNYECGSQSNTCGGTMDCGACQTNASCISGLCQCDYVECDSACCDNGQTCYSANCCTPKTCSQQGYECGSQTDTCGNTISCGSCGSNEECKNGKCRCEFEECGGDCCDDGEVCDGSDNCCLPNCAGKECGDDGCDGSCGTCGVNESCNTGICECDYTECNSVCCNNGEVCDGSNNCCLPNCAGKECGDDGCGGSCGSCGINETCTTGICECDYVECDGTCCSSGQVCYSDVCCTPQTCIDQSYECGSQSDTCGGTIDCGTCGVNESCNSGTCECDYVECNGSCCSSGQVCYSDFCCTPKTCVEQGYECGSQSDTCGGVLDCGSCDDGLYCTVGETCDNGVCIDGTARNCDDGVECTVNDRCEEGAGCISTPDDNMCIGDLLCISTDGEYGCWPGFKIIGATDGNIIYSIDGNGENKINLFSGGSNPYANPQSNMIVFVQNNDIYAMDLNTLVVVQITVTPEVERGPEISPDGTKIVFSRMVVDDYQLFTMNIDGTGEQQITSYSSSSLDPSWSPDGSKIVYVHGELNDYKQVEIINSDGSGRVSKTSWFRKAYAPSWSPDGTVIALAASNEAGQYRHPCFVKLDGTMEYCATGWSYYIVSPRWSSDGLLFYADWDFPSGDGSISFFELIDQGSWYLRSYLGTIPNTENTASFSIFHD